MSASEGGTQNCRRRLFQLVRPRAHSRADRTAGDSARRDVPAAAFRRGNSSECARLGSLAGHTVASMAVRREAAARWPRSMRHSRPEEIEIAANCHPGVPNCIAAHQCACAKSTSAAGGATASQEAARWTPVSRPGVRIVLCAASRPPGSRARARVPRRSANRVLRPLASTSGNTVRIQ